MFTAHTGLTDILTLMLSLIGFSHHAELRFLQCNLLGSTLDRDTFLNLGIRYYIRNTLCRWSFNHSVSDLPAISLAI